MDQKRIGHLWNVLSSAANIKHLNYEEAITIGGVFGEMKTVILQQQERISELLEEIERLRTIEQAYEGLKKAL